MLKELYFNNTPLVISVIALSSIFLSKYEHLFEKFENEVNEITKDKTKDKAKESPKSTANNISGTRSLVLELVLMLTPILNIVVAIIYGCVTIAIWYRYKDK